MTLYLAATGAALGVSLLTLAYLALQDAGTVIFLGLWAMFL